MQGIPREADDPAPELDIRGVRHGDWNRSRVTLQDAIDIFTAGGVKRRLLLTWHRLLIRRVASVPATAVSGDSRDVAMYWA